MDETSRLILAVDSTSVKTAEVSLDKMATAGGRAETASQRMESAFKKVTRESQASARLMQLNAHQTQQLAFQLNDLGVQIASGQSPLIALIQQGSQLSGTFGGVGGALRAVGTLLTPARLIFGGLATVLGSVAFAAYEGEQQSVRLTRALLLTGNAAGITAGQFNGLSRTIADSTNTGIGSARATLEGLVASGRFSGEALTATAKAAQLLEQATGKASDEILQDFVQMTNGVARWAESTNRSYHFLTAAQLQYIKTLEDQGDQQKAVEVTMQALSRRVEQAAGTLGTLESGWKRVSRAAGDAWDAMLGIGRESTIEEKIAEIDGKLAKRFNDGRGQASVFDFLNTQRFTDGRGSGSDASQRAALELERQRLVAQKASAEVAASASRTNAATEQARIQFDKLREQSLSKQAKLAKELANANALADRAGLSSSDRAGVLAGIREKYADKGSIGAALALGKADLQADIQAIQNELSGLTSAYKNAENVLEASRAANLLDERDYFNAKGAFIRLNSDAQVRALEEENARIQSQKATGKERIDNLKQIAENEAKIAIIKAEATAAGTVLDIRQADSIAKVARGYTEARISAQQYLETLVRQQQREVQAVGLSDAGRERFAGLNQIEDRYQSQRDQLEGERRRQEITEESYRNQLAIIDEFQAKATASFEAGFKARRDAEGVWASGASRALQNYLDEAGNVAKQSEDLWTNAFKGMEDALVNFVTTGKLDFKSLANSILADLARVQIKSLLSSAGGGGSGGLLGSIVSMFTGGGGGSGPAFSLPTVEFGGAFAAGGDPPVGKVSLVGERGPELFIPRTPGTIVPNHKMGGNTVVIQQTNHIGEGVSPAGVAAAMNYAVEKAKADIAYSMNSRGQFA